MERGRLPSAAAWPGLACVLGRFAPLQRPRRFGVTRDPLSECICFVLRCVLFVLDLDRVSRTYLTEYVTTTRVHYHKGTLRVHHKAEEICPVVQ